MLERVRCEAAEVVDREAYVVDEFGHPPCQMTPTRDRLPEPLDPLLPSRDARIGSTERFCFRAPHQRAVRVNRPADADAADLVLLLPRHPSAGKAGRAQITGSALEATTTG